MDNGGEKQDNLEPTDICLLTSAFLLYPLPLHHHPGAQIPTVTPFFSTLENASENVTSPGTLMLLKAQPKEEHFYQWNFRTLMEKACTEGGVGPLSVCGTVRNRSSEYNLL